MLVVLQNARKLEVPGKFDTLWLGPFIIKKKFHNNFIQFQNLDGSDPKVALMGVVARNIGCDVCKIEAFQDDELLWCVLVWV
jgi:hypothetical protein